MNNETPQLSPGGKKPLRILVVIASYGSQNDSYLRRVLDEYRSMPHRIQLVVVSNIRKDLGPDVDVRVGLPSRNPYSLPFAHKQILANQIADHDLFVYSEDDILITAENIEAFLEQANVLPPHQIPGFLRIEERPDHQIQYCDIHGSAYWDPRSVTMIDGRVFAYLSNEHAACYILTAQQLKLAVDSGKFLVPPYAGRYNMLETAATDPYTRCGLRKLICISEIERSSVHHLPNKYIDRFGLPLCDLKLQLEELRRIVPTDYLPLIQMEPRLRGGRCLRDHYESARAEILSLMSGSVHSVLSLGCGQTEIALAHRGIRVLAIPVEPAGTAVAASKGVEVVKGDLQTATEKLKGQRFDCLLLTNVLHLVKEPMRVLRALLPFIKDGGTVIAISPNIGRIRVLRSWILWGEGATAYRNAGIHLTTPSVVREWLRASGLIPATVLYSSRNEDRSFGTERPGFLASILAREFTIVATVNQRLK